MSTWRTNDGEQNDGEQKFDILCYFHQRGTLIYLVKVELYEMLISENLLK